MAGRMGPAQTTGAAAGRGLALVAIAVVIGLLLLSQVDSTGDVATADPPATTAAADGSTDTTPAVDETPAETTPVVADGTADTTPAEEPATTEAVAVLEARPQNEVKVLVANAKTGVNGAAGNLSNQVQPFGYIMGEPTNTIELAADTSFILYQAGYAVEANRLAGELGWPVDATTVQPLAEPSPVESLDGANLLIILGTDRASAG